MVIPTEDVVPNNSCNVRYSQHAMMQAQFRSQIIRNYSTMPKFVGVSMDRDNIFYWSDRYATCASINDLKSMRLDFQKPQHIFHSLGGLSLHRVRPVSPKTLNYQQCNTL